MPIKRDPKTGRFASGGKAEQPPTDRPLTLQDIAAATPDYYYPSQKPRFFQWKHRRRSVRQNKDIHERLKTIENRGYDDRTAKQLLDEGIRRKAVINLQATSREDGQPKGYWKDSETLVDLWVQASRSMHSPNISGKIYGVKRYKKARCLAWAKLEEYESLAKNLDQKSALFPFVQQCVVDARCNAMETDSRWERACAMVNAQERKRRQESGSQA